MSFCAPSPPLYGYARVVDDCERRHELDIVLDGERFCLRHRRLRPGMALNECASTLRVYTVATGPHRELNTLRDNMCEITQDLKFSKLSGAVWIEQMNTSITDFIATPFMTSERRELISFIGSRSRPNVADGFDRIEPAFPLGLALF